MNSILPDPKSQNQESCVRPWYTRKCCAAYACTARACLSVCLYLDVGIWFDIQNVCQRDYILYFDTHTQLLDSDNKLLSRKLCITHYTTRFCIRGRVIIFTFGLVYLRSWFVSSSFFVQAGISYFFANVSIVFADLVEKLSAFSCTNLARLGDLIFEEIPFNQLWGRLTE